MSWWEDIRSWSDGLTKNLWRVKNALYSWIWDIAKQWGEYGVSVAESLTRAIWNEIEDFTDIVFHTWSEVKAYADGKRDEAKAYTDKLEASFLAVLTATEEVAGAARDWVNNADKWFDARFDTMKDKVVGWVIDRFEYILDSIFTKEGS